jgi:predicted ATPase/DNA-binding SARP family transcriptional activator/tetratricopeptide (TPR) repeat protein
MGLQFGILGPLEVHSPLGALRLAGHKPRVLLAALLLERNRPVSAERLARVLWGDDAGHGSGRAVRVHVHRLRTALGASDLLVTTQAGYELRVEAGALDLDRFEALAREGRELLAADPREASARFRAALELWRGPALADVAGEPFAQPEIVRLEEQRLELLEARIEADLATGRHRELVGELHELASRHPLRERLHAQLMLALYRCGRQADALAAYRHARTLLSDELGLEPGIALRDLEHSILTHDPALEADAQSGVDLAAASGLVVGEAEQDRRRKAVAFLRRGSPGARSRVDGDVRPARPARLERGRTVSVPARLKPIFGRERDVAALLELLEHARLVTLTGPGGAGKTTLALEVARQLAPRVDEDVHFIELAPVTESLHVATAISQELGVEILDGESAREALLRFVAQRPMALVLDNFEHLLEAAPLVSAMLASSPQLIVACTSRAPLRISAERVYPVTPLPVPEGVLPDDSASVLMFCDRARARDPRFAITAENARSVAMICRRLDGLPLALELAAARIDFMTAREIAASLGDALELLVGGARDAPQRQRTLRDTLDWSHWLLSGADQRVFARFAVFAGGATLEAAQKVTEARLSTLESLCVNNLVARAGERLVMLEPIREYAAELLEAMPDAHELRATHARWYLQFAEAVAARVARGSELAGYHAEGENLRASLAWALASGDGDLALALACASAPWWERTGQRSSGLELLQAAMTLAGDRAPMRLRARALHACARLRPRAPGVQDQRRADWRASLALWRQIGDVQQQIECLTMLITITQQADERLVAIALAEEALTLARDRGDDALIGRALAARALADPDDPVARALAQNAVPLLVAAGALETSVLVLGALGYFALADGQSAEALDLLEDAVPIADALDSHFSRWNIHGNIGLAKLFLGDPAAALSAFQLSLQAAEAGGLDFDEALVGIAAVSARSGEYEHAARLVGAARAHAPAGLDAPEQRIADILNDEYLEPARSRNQRRWDRVAAQGAMLSRADALLLGRTISIDASRASATADSNSTQPPRA